MFGVLIDGGWILTCGWFLIGWVAMVVLCVMYVLRNVCPIAFLMKNS